MVSFEKQESKKYKQDTTFSILSFGARRIACPGSNLGLSMAYIAVATWVQCFDWKVVGDGEKAKVNTEVTKGVFIHMAHPLKCLSIVKFNPFDSVV